MGQCYRSAHRQRVHELKAHRDADQLDGTTAMACLEAMRRPCAQRDGGRAEHAGANKKRRIAFPIEHPLDFETISVHSFDQPAPCRIRERDQPADCYSIAMPMRYVVASAPRAGGI